MSTPSFVQFIDPLLRYLVSQTDEVAARNAYEALADQLGLTDEDRLELLPSGTQPLYKNRIGWAHDRLKRAGLSTSQGRGRWVLTQAGREFAAKHREALSKPELHKLAHLSRKAALIPISEGVSPAEEELKTDESQESPEERIQGGLLEIQESVAADLLDRILEASPLFFEHLVLDLLLAMGYGASRKAIQHVGGSGDGGLDGVISLDRLGLEKVYVQAKRWQNTVGRPDVQGFYGALAGRRATKGVFITTSNYSREALGFAASIEGVVLIDGKRLAELMILEGIGISHQLLKIPKLDSDYFSEE